MRKLIVAISAALVGIVANAALANWSMDSVYVSGTTSVAENYVVYYFDTSLLSITTATSNLASGDVSFTTLGFVASDLTDNEGYADGKSGNIYNAGDDVNGYLVIFNSDDAADATLAYITGVETESINNLGSNVFLDFGDVTGSKVADNWTAIGGAEPVPEPTSGLLLLVGGALLALKRRRA